jgi:DNA polymerase-3 subunit gamma/tau
LSLADVRRIWPDIVEATKAKRRVAWMHLTQNSQVLGLTGDTLTLGFVNAGARDSFVQGKCDEVLRQAAREVIGAEWRIDTIVDPGAQTGLGAPGGASGETRVDRPAAPVASEPFETAGAGGPSEPPPWATDDAPSPSAPPTPQPNPAAEAARQAVQPTRQPGRVEQAPVAAPEDDHADPAVDPPLDEEQLGGAELLAKELGAQIIEEIKHER